MQAYLAEKYMSGPKADAIISRTAPKKKKKRKPDVAPTGGSATIVDDDAGWGGAANVMDVEDDDAAEAIVASDRAFKKRRMELGEGTSGWTTLREPTPPPPADEQPVVVATEGTEPFRGGLLTKQQLRAQLPSSQKLPKEEEEDSEAFAAAQETVYRDASGRKIDMKLEKAEAARKKREREEKEAQRMEWGKGLVQRDDTEKRKEEEERIRKRGFTRHVDDEELNRAQKEKERWNDPAAAFMTVRYSQYFLHYPRVRADASEHLQKKRTKGPRKLEYTGPPPPPNRFGIKPGYRWDGVGEFDATLLHFLTIAEYG
jgi:pre-mRNA-splicing factor CWC26